MIKEKPAVEFHDELCVHCRQLIAKGGQTFFVTVSGRPQRVHKDCHTIILGLPARLVFSDGK